MINLQAITLDIGLTNFNNQHKSISEKWCVTCVDVNSLEHNVLLKISENVKMYTRYL